MVTAGVDATVDLDATARPNGHGGRGCMDRARVAVAVTLGHAGAALVLHRSVAPTPPARLGGGHPRQDLGVEHRRRLVTGRFTGHIPLVGRDRGFRLVVPVCDEERPLTGLRATLELAQLDPERADRAIPQAIAQVDRTTALIDDLLQLARDDAGVGATRRPTDVDDLVRTELRDLGTRRPGITVQRGRIDPVQVMADPGGLTRVVRNLLDNAALHGRSTVRAGLVVDHEAWTLTVDDDGPGIPAGERAAVFERFHRLDQSRSRGTGGTGLGLAIVAGVIAAHRGTITVGDSDLGGAQMVVRVPLQPS